MATLGTQVRGSRPCRGCKLRRRRGNASRRSTASGWRQRREESARKRRRRRGERTSPRRGAPLPLPLAATQSQGPSASLVGHAHASSSRLRSVSAHSLPLTTVRWKQRAAWSSNCSRTSYHGQRRTSGSCAQVKRVRVSTTADAPSTASSQDSWPRLATSPAAMAPEAARSTARSSRTRTSWKSTVFLGFCPWRTRGPTPIARSSSSSFRHSLT
mmetsp:Transcript_72723/g.168524  ORF Transcript_72723/g.168524 Transcript_72723/m.168524 type:complete len:214 (-) Transcript_72723:471-1112(-)